MESSDGLMNRGNHEMGTPLLRHGIAVISIHYRYMWTGAGEENMLPLFKYKIHLS